MGVLDNGTEGREGNRSGKDAEKRKEKEKKTYLALTASIRSQSSSLVSAMPWKRPSSSPSPTVMPALHTIISSRPNVSTQCPMAVAIETADVTSVFTKNALSPPKMRCSALCVGSVSGSGSLLLPVLPPLSSPFPLSLLPKLVPVPEEAGNEDARPKGPPAMLVVVAEMRRRVSQSSGLPVLGFVVCCGVGWRSMQQMEAPSEA